MNLLNLFCNVDDFCHQFIPQWQRQQIATSERKRIKRSRLSPSEVMTIVIHFHQSHYREFKSYYQGYVCVHLKQEFPDLVSYNRFVELQQSVLIPLCFYLQSRKGQCQGISFVDSTALAVCHNRRIQRHRTFQNLASRGKTTMGWFYGFKLHLIVNDQGELLAFKVTPGNVDDRDPLPEMVNGLSGKLFGDKGYISQVLFEQFAQQGLHLFTTIRKNMKPRMMSLFDRVLLRKRFLIETINDQLKNISNIEHSRHRSIANFMVNLIAGLIAYSWQEKKPSLNLEQKDMQQLVSV